MSAVGTGKTYSTSRVVDWVQQGLSTNANDEAFAYFYCNKQDPARRKPKEILRSMIRQLATGPWREREKGKTIHKTVHDLWIKSQDKGISSTFAQWEACLLALVDTYPKTTIVLDAFDECETEQRRDLLKLFTALASRHEEANRVKIFISTRPEEDVLQHLDQYPVIRVKEKHNADDIESFVRTKIAEHSRWSKMPEDFQAEVVQILLEKSGDMFLFASLQIQHLLLCRTQPALKSRLEKLPDSLEKTYQEIYQNATSESDERKLLERAIKWVMCSAGPLNTVQLLLAICQDADSEGVIEQRQDVDEELILVLSQNLLYLERGTDDDEGQRDPVWRLAHQAVSVFFENGAYYNSYLAHYEAGKVCLMVLLDTFGGDLAQPRSDLEDDVSETNASLVCHCDQSEISHRQIRTSLVGYAFWAWPTHVRAQEYREARCVAGLSQKLQEFLGEPEQGSSIYERWMEHVCEDPFLAPGWSIFATRRMPKGLKGEHHMNPISLVCYLGLYTTLAEEWWDQARLSENVGHSAVSWKPWGLRSLDFPRLRDRPLRWSLVALACAHDEVETMKRLLDRGAHFKTIEEEEEVSPIFVAAQTNSVESVKELLRRGCEIYPPITKQHIYLLHFAIREDSLDVVELLLSQVLAEPLDVERALNQVSCRYGFKSAAAITLLVDKGVNVNTPLQGGTLLAAAVLRGWKQLVRRLLKNGADVNTQFYGRRFNNALEAAILRENSPLALLLIEHGARGTSRVIASVITWEKHGEEALQALFEQSLDLNKTWTDGGGDNTSALIAAVNAGKVDGACRLIQHGADVNLKVGGKHGDALSTVFAATLDSSVDQYPTAAMIKVLEEAGASLESLEGDRLNTALAAAAFGGLEDMVQCFLARGASPNAFCAHHYTTALGAAAASEHPRASHIIQTLLDRGADVNAYFPHYVTYKRRRSHRLALDYPAWWLLFFEHISTRSERMQNCLHLASILISHGAVWDVDFAQWRKCLEKQAPEFSQRNSQSLDQMLQMLKRNRTAFFLTNPRAASDEQWRIKDGKDPSWTTREVLSQMF
jgi:ankyrin repeat protein